MACKVIEATDVMAPGTLTALIYAPPGSGKTSLAQALHDPITLDFDGGSYRADGRKKVLQFDSWDDVNDAEQHIARHREVVVDTVGSCLDKIKDYVIRRNAKNGTSAGGLSINGWGALLNVFVQWVSHLRGSGKDVVLIAHEKESSDGDVRVFRPDIKGSSYDEVCRVSDLIGHIHFNGIKRVISWSPSDNYVGKNCANLPTVAIPDGVTGTLFLADIFSTVKAKFATLSKESAESAGLIKTWLDLTLPRLETADHVNDAVGEYLNLPQRLQTIIKRPLWDRAKTMGLVWDAGEKKFKVVNDPAPL